MSPGGTTEPGTGATPSDPGLTDASSTHESREDPGSAPGPGAMSHLPRPIFLDLTRIRMPVGARTSIGRRISGVILAAGVPGGAYELNLSLRDEAGFAQVAALFGQLAF